MKKIVLINFGGIGDEILFLPTIKSLKKKYPNSKITLVLEPRANCIKELANLIDNTIQCDIKNGNNFFKTLKLLVQLWCGDFDMIVSSGTSKMLAPVLFLSGIKQRYGYDTGLISRILLSKAVKLNQNQYAANMYHDLVSGFCDFEPELPEIMVKSSFQTNPMEEKMQLPTNKKIILIHPGVSELSKRKNIIKSYEKWDEVIENLKNNYTVLLAGGPDDKEVIEKINKDGIVNMYGKTKNIKDLAILMKKADLVLCVDSAPMHIAVGLKKPLVAIFGPTDEKKLLPKDEKFISITTHLSCRPCLWTRRKECCKEPTCLKVNAQAVLRGVEKVFTKCDKG